jgi:DNA primase
VIEAEDILKLITTEDVIEILTDLGSDYPRSDKQGNLYFTTICHCGDSRKLQYFTDSKFFLCYTNCGSMSVFDLLMNVNHWTFVEALNFLAKCKGINPHKKKVGLQEKKYHNEDFEFLDKHLYIPKKHELIELPKFNKDILRIFDDYYPDVWEDEGISEEIARYFGIKFYFNQYKAIIPHLDINGNLIGIRSRNFFQHEVDSGKKYMPITIQGLTYRYPTNFNLYGLYENKNNIRKFKKVVLFESEKSVWKHGSLYGQENNIAVASLGMTLSLYQRDLLLNQGIEELIVCYDKQYLVEYLDEKDSKEYKEFVKYIRNLIKIAKMFINYCNVSLVLCWDDDLDYKDAPIDKGKEIFEKLMKSRYLVSDIKELEELIE